MSRLFYWLFILALSSCQQVPSQKPTPKIALSTDPTTLDPRKNRSIEPLTILNLLYEGLLRRTDHDELECALAKQMKISKDGKTYLFFLRDATWETGEPITAYDVEASWKEILNPTTSFANANYFFLIRGAKEAKLGSGSPETIGIRVIDTKTLEVTLEQPAPYFPELIAHPIFYPVHEEVRKGNKEVVASGPFYLKEWKQNESLHIVKNPAYWEAEKIALPGIDFSILNDTTALQLFRQEQLDWVGSPTHTLPIDALPSLRKEEILKMVPAAAVQLLYLCVDHPILKNVHIRQALSLALNRKDLVVHVAQGGQLPSTTFVPPSFHLQEAPLFEDGYIDKAQTLFLKGCEELGISKEDIPPLVVAYCSTERNHRLAQAIQEMWNQHLHIPIHLQGSEIKLYYENLYKRNFTIALTSFFADFFDPLTFLCRFEQASENNPTGWSDPEYQHYLDYAMREHNPTLRLHYLAKAEQILTEAMPTIPLFNASFNYLQSPKLKNVSFSCLGIINFRKAYLQQ